MVPIAPVAPHRRSDAVGTALVDGRSRRLPHVRSDGQPDEKSRNQLIDTHAAQGNCENFIQVVHRELANGLPIPRKQSLERFDIVEAVQAIPLRG